MADARRRLRSGTVVLGAMSLLAAALTACSSDPDKRCVDRGGFGAWGVEDESARLGIPESSGLITDEYARFLPHVTLQTSDYTSNTARI